MCGRWLNHQEIKIAIMKYFFLFFFLNVFGVFLLYGQKNMPDIHEKKPITSLIDDYSLAREKSDTTLLKKILTADVDQLVSTGEWRNGIRAAVTGMLKSSGSRPGTRTLHIENIKMINPSAAVVNCRYEIQNTDGTTRKMWSTFIVVTEKNTWKISAIRNMLPAK